MLLAIAKFVMELLTGDVYRLWAAHKQKEADNAAATVASMSDAALDKRVQSDITRS